VNEFSCWLRVSPATKRSYNEVRSSKTLAAGVCVYLPRPLLSPAYTMRQFT
jgi:hypothetical protein